MTSKQTVVVRLPMMRLELPFSPLMTTRGLGRMGIIMPFFFKRAWSIVEASVVAASVVAAIKSFFAGGRILKEIDHTVVSLVYIVPDLS